MIIIAHRSNLDGPNKELENKPEHILEVIKKYPVEVDVWYVEESWFLGHDEPQYKVDSSFFNDRMWLHCKNLKACSELSKTDLHWFWHESDKITLTSKGVVWAYPEVYVDDGITVELGYSENLPKHIRGICTDYPEKYNKQVNQ